MDLKTSFDTDAILHGILSRSPLKAALSGGIYVGDDRPADSTAEDVVINTFVLTQEYHPQQGVSNVNVYVSDKPVRIGGKEQFVADRVRLKMLTDIARPSVARGARHGAGDHRRGADRATGRWGQAAFHEHQSQLEHPRLTHHQKQKKLTINQH